MVRITINGKEVEVNEGATIMEAADQAGINIPRLCAHEELTPYGGCRLCLVDVEGARSLLPSCTTPIRPDMIIQTETEQIKKARKFVLEMLFSERNHFCMYCPESDGDCELQAAAYEQGMTHWFIQPQWENYPVDTSHEFLVMDSNRCILCRRCVRACDELVHQSTLGTENRGFYTLISKDEGLPWGESSCVSCGTCLQVCPTGTIMDKHSAYMGLDAQAAKTKSVCIECGLGCGTEVLVRDNQLMKVNGDWDSEINNGILCKKGRFLSVKQNSQTRYKAPMVRDGKQLKEISWEEAAILVAEKVKGKGAAAVASSKLSAEALTAFKDLFTQQSCGLVTSTEACENDYSEVLGMFEKDPVQVIVQKATKAISGKANSMAAIKYGLTSPLGDENEVLFLAMTDDEYCDCIVEKAKASTYTIVQSTYASDLTAQADLIIPVKAWPEQSGHYISLTGKLQEARQSMQAPKGIQSNLSFFKTVAETAGLSLTADWKELL